MKMTSFLGVSSRSFTSLENCSTSVSSLLVGECIYLDYCDIEWFALEMSRDHSVIFEIPPKYCISDSFVGYEAYSINFKGFLPTTVDLMVI